MVKKNINILALILSALIQLALAPQPLSEILEKDAYRESTTLEKIVEKESIERKRLRKLQSSYDTEEGRKLARVRGDTIYLVSCHWGSLEFEVSKLRGALQRKSKGKVAIGYLINAVQMIDYHCKTIPYGEELGLRKVSSSAEIFVGCHKRKKWTLCEKLLYTIKNRMLTVRDRYGVLERKLEDVNDVECIGNSV